MFWSGGIQFRLRGPPGLSELRVVPSPDTGDKPSGRYQLDSARNRFLKFGNGESSLDAARLIASIDPCARVVHVSVEKTRNDSSSSNVNGLCSGNDCWRLTDVHDASIPDRQRRPNDTSAIYEFSIRENKIANAVGLLRLVRK